MFIKKKRFLKLEQDVEQAFKEVKKDFKRVASWIEFIEEELKSSEKGKKRLDEVEAAIKRIDEGQRFLEGGKLNSPKQDKHKQQTVVHVQTAVQTPVQTEKIKELTVNERMIVWALLNTESRMSHEDLSKILGKNKSTIRGQINTIKKKEPNLIEESLEISGKKRLYISEKSKKRVIKVIKSLKNEK